MATTNSLVTIEKQVHYASIHSTTHNLERCLRPSTSAIKKKFKKGYMKKEIKEFDEIENLASRFHQVYQEELRRQDKKTFES